MILLLYVILALLLFCGIVVASIGTSPQKASRSRALLAVNEMVKLDSALVRNADQMFDDAEYRLLRSNPALAPVARRLRKERQELALMWLALLVRDLRKLSRFRSFLIRGGVSTETSDEIAVFFTFVSSMLFLTALRLFVRVFGAFAARGIASRARVAIEASSHASARVLDRLPFGTWGEVAHNWQSQGFTS